MSSANMMHKAPISLQVPVLHLSFDVHGSISAYPSLLFVMEFITVHTTTITIGVIYLTRVTALSQVRIYVTSLRIITHLNDVYSIHIGMKCVCIVLHGRKAILEKKNLGLCLNNLWLR